jgi:sterol desaturase/sphingolipid hydroxylase (fatty acid hydroxylase superfamily)
MASCRSKLLLPALILGAAAAILVGERRSPLRQRTQAEPTRIVRNLVLGTLSVAVVSAVEGPVIRPFARQAEVRRRGLAQRIPAPAWLRDAASILAMDYTIYLWHILTHKVPVLWRLHLVHHVDLDMDATTALRFHAADMLVSVPYRAAQVALLGVSPRALRGWQAFFFVSVLFHHSNLRLPPGLERRLARVLTTPRMHGIHHSTVRGETNSNWSSGLSLWDHLHRTFRLDVADRRVQVGVPAYRDPSGIRLRPSLAMPFRRQRDAWRPQPGRLVRI